MLPLATTGMSLSVLAAGTSDKSRLGKGKLRCGWPWLLLLLMQSENASLLFQALEGNLVFRLDVRASA